METRRPLRALSPFVERLWASDGAPRHTAGTTHERILPTGSTHLVLRLSSEPLKLFEGTHYEQSRTLGPAVVGGVRSRAYSKDIARPVPSVGAVLAPGAAFALFGVPASELAETHTPLEALWGREADLLCDELASLTRLDERLDSFERALTARLPTVRGIHPGVARALDGSVVEADRASTLASRAGLGPRRFAQLFRDAVGLSPKRWLRLRRFQRTVAQAREPEVDWAELAFELGYSDQPHLAREFREFADLTPSEYQRLAPPDPNHVPIERRGPISSRRR